MASETAGSEVEADFQVDQADAGQRLDQFLAAQLPAYSRARLSSWIRAGQARVDGARVKPSYRVNGGEQVQLRAQIEAAVRSPAQAIDLAVVHADAQVLVIDKPAGLVVHPAAGNADGTLLNALLHYDPALEQLPRAGIVHRLDKQTSGLMVVARTLTAHTDLVRQLQARSVSRHYQALVYGRMISGGSVDAPLGRHPVDRKKMAVRGDGKAAITHYRVGQRFADFTLLEVQLETGRTHQIRVHMAHQRFPLVGDPVYGIRLRLPPAAGEALAEALRGFQRQALHAARLEFDHPDDGSRAAFEAPAPADLQALLRALREDPTQAVDG